MQTKLVLLGTGTPNACPNANGPSSAVVVGDRAYLALALSARPQPPILTAWMPCGRIF